MLKKIASLAAMLSASLTVSSCETVAYKPIICQPGTALKDGRCQKVTTVKRVKTPTRPRTDTTAPRPIVAAPAPAKPAPAPFLGRPSAEY